MKFSDFMENKETESLKEKTEGFKLYLLRLWQDFIDDAPDDFKRAAWHKLEEKQMCRDFLNALKMWECIQGFSLNDLKGSQTVEPESIKGTGKLPYKYRLQKAQIAMNTITSQQTQPAYSKIAKETLREFDRQVMQFVK